jgi:hypothetical protein
VHAVTVTVDIDPAHMAEAVTELNSRVVPTVAQSPGFVAGYWLAPETGDGGMLRGWSIIFAESADTADAMATMALASPTPPGVTITGATVREVIAHA